MLTSCLILPAVRKSCAIVTYVWCCRDVFWGAQNTGKHSLSIPTSLYQDSTRLQSCYAVGRNVSTQVPHSATPIRDSWNSVTAERHLRRAASVKREGGSNILLWGWHRYSYGFPFEPLYKKWGYYFTTTVSEKYKNKIRNKVQSWFRRKWTLNFEIMCIRILFFSSCS